MYVGADCTNIQGRRFNLTGPRMFNGQYGPNARFLPEEVPDVDGICDSGAFNDSPEDRLTPDAALDRQLRWEVKAEKKWGTSYRHASLVSYDLLIDEKWANGVKRKERWGVREADNAVRVTVDAAAYLDSQRERLAPRKLVMACQGVDAVQYAECASGVLNYCQPGDTFGLGGWCILGMHRSWMPTFWQSMRRTLPLVAAAGIKHVHIFGVMWRVPLGGLLWLADQYGLAVSTDSKKAAMDCTWGKQKFDAGALAETWEENVAIWRDRLTNLRSTEFYREPPSPRHSRQVSLFESCV